MRLGTRRVPALAGLGVAALGLFALLYFFAWASRPDVSTPPPPPPARLLKEAVASREKAGTLDAAHPIVINRAVDYSAGAAAPWWPKREAPVLAELVHEGKLPPVAQRTGSEPEVVEGVDGIGRYGGTWYRFVNANNDYSTIYWRLSGANLIRWSPEGYPLVPHVAKAWKASPDDRVLTFTLRRGMRWSDGAPVTSDDIVYWYRYEVLYFKVESPLLRAGRTLGRVEKIDELHVRFVFDAPNPLFPERLASTAQNFEDYSEYIVPAHYLRRYHPLIGDQALIRRSMAALKLSSPVALYRRMKDYLNPEHPRLWPWVYHTFAPTTPKTFVRNPYYFAVDSRGNQLPYLDRLVLAIKPKDLIAVAAANGEPSMQDRHLQYEDYSLLMGNAARNGYHVYHWKSATQSPFAIFPNLNRRIDPGQPETRWKHELLNDVRFREALSLAINRADIIQAEFNGQTEPAQIDPGRDSPYHDERLFRAFTEYDPARANRLLDEIGLTRRDIDGFRTFPDGTPMTFVLNHTDYTPPGPAQFVSEDWGRVGVHAIVRLRARKLFEQEKYALEHDFTIWTGESEFYPLVEPRSFVPVYLQTYYAPGYGAWYQDGGLYGDPAAGRPAAIEPPLGHPLRRAMEILEEANVETSEAARREKMHQILEIAADNLWTISICTPPPQLVVVKDGFRNVPRAALFGACFLTPANTGIETYYWEHPSTPPAVTAETRRAILTITPPPEQRAIDSGGPPLARTIGGWLVELAVLAGLVALGVRQPFIGRRLLFMAPTLLVVSIVIFTLVQLPPGDYVDTRILYLEMQGTPSNDQLAADLRRNFHLLDPAIDRYARWLGLAWFRTFRPEDEGLLQGNLGRSMEYERPVNEVMGERLRLTIIVTLGSVVFTWALALPLGVYSAFRAGSKRDTLFTVVGMLALSVPSFLLALVVMHLAKRMFGVNVDGLFSPEFAMTPAWTFAKTLDLLRHLWLPVVVLAAGGIAAMARVMRANVLDELKKPYVVTARARGLRPWRLLWKYPVRVALNPFVSEMGGLFPSLVSGGTIVALVLSLPMIGPTMLEALLSEDVYLAGSMLMLLSVLGVAGTLISDLLLLWLDPRVRYNGGTR
jgi:ABC-type dipeptide/oligopeptide/nickel transport system permease component/ABC-type transport system substrate-binding protein